MSDVRDIFITSEVARELDITPAYLVKLAKTVDLNETEFRETSKGSYLFNQSGIEKLRAKLRRK